MIIVKSALTKDGKPYQVARFDSDFDPGRRGARVRFFGKEIGFRELEMYALGQYALDTMKARVRQGIGSGDSPMPPLKVRRRRRWSIKQQQWVEYGEFTGYPDIKRATGGKSIRDLTFTGKMLNDFSVRSVSSSEVRMDITTTESRMKARTNEIRSPWFGWSPQDVSKIYARARQLFGDTVRSAGIGVVARGTERTGIAAPVWMNPFQRLYPGSRDAEWADRLRVRIKSGNTRIRRG